MTRPAMRVSAVVLDSGDANGLAAFYRVLLGWEAVEEEPGWVRLRDPSGGPAAAGLSFALDEAYVPPVWPTAPADQRAMAHLDIAVDDLAAAVTWAVECGATVAGHQPQDHVRVMIDPAGHPFCLFLDGVG